MEILREKQRGIFKATPEIKKEISKHYRDELKVNGGGLKITSRGATTNDVLDDLA
jgi:hypothetical protein